MVPSDGLIFAAIIVNGKEVNPYYPHLGFKRGNDRYWTYPSLVHWGEDYVIRMDETGHEEVFYGEEINGLHPAIKHERRTARSRRR